MDAKTYRNIKEKVDTYEKAKEAIDSLEEFRLNLFNGYPDSVVRNIYTNTSRTCNSVSVPSFIQKGLALNVREFIDNQIKKHQETIDKL